MAQTYENSLQGALKRLFSDDALQRVRGVLFGAVVLMVFVAYAVRTFRGLTSAEAMDYAQLGRNLASGHGFTTHVIQPARLWYKGPLKTDEISETGLPDIRHAPVYPSLLAVGFKALCGKPAAGVAAWSVMAERRVIVPMGILFSLATGWLVYRLGRRQFDGRVAVFGAAGYLLSQTVLTDSVSGLPLSVVAFLATAASYAALVAAERRKASGRFKSWFPPFLLCAALCVAGFLTRYAFAVLVVPFAILLGPSALRFRLSAVLGFLLLFAVGIAPWLARNWSVSGGLLGLAPYAALQDTSHFPGDTFARSLHPLLDNSDVANDIKHKLRTNLARLYDADLRTLGSGFVVCLFFGSFLHRFLKRETRWFRWCLALALLSMLVFASICGKSAARSLDMFLPLIVLYGTAFFFLLLDRLELGDPLANGLVAVAFVLLTAASALFDLVAPIPAPQYPPYFPPYIARVSRYLGLEQVLCTDIPEGTAWYANRLSLLLPLSTDDIPKAERAGVKLGGLYLTTETGNKRYVEDLVAGDERSWLPLLNGTIPPDFPFTDGIRLPPGTREQLFLTANLGRFPQ